MKKSIYISGIIATILFMIGGLFKIYHLPGAGIIATFSIVLFCFWFLPAALINNFRNQEKKGNLYLYIITFIVAFLTLMADLFNIQHWPGSGWLLSISLPLPFILFLPAYIYYHRKQKIKSNANLVYIMVFLTFISAFSVILALRVSKNVLDAEISVQNDINNVSDYFITTNQAIYNDYTNNIEIQNVKAKSDSICKYINDIKIQLIRAVDGNKDAISENNQIDYNMIFNKDEAHVPMNILEPFRDNGLASDLKSKIIKYKEDMTSNIKDDEITVTFINNLLSTDDYKNLDYKDHDSRDHDNNTETWENYTFFNLPLISTLNVLSSIERNIRMTEADVLNSITENLDQKVTIASTNNK